MRKSAVLMLLCLGLSVPTAPMVSAQEGRECTPDDVSTRLVLNDTSVPAGDPIPMKLVAKNTSGESCTMGFPSGRGGTVRVFKNGNPVWEHGYCRVYTQHIEFETWEAGHRDAYRYRWKQYRLGEDKRGRFDCDGKRDPAKAGTYSAKGIFFGTEPDAKTEPVEFRITG